MDKNSGLRSIIILLSIDVVLAIVFVLAMGELICSSWDCIPFYWIGVIILPIFVFITIVTVLLYQFKWKKLKAAPIESKLQTDMSVSLLDKPKVKQTQVTFRNNQSKVDLLASSDFDAAELLLCSNCETLNDPHRLVCSKCGSSLKFSRENLEL